MNTSYSVIIPTYNRAHTVVKAVESALNQTVAPLEVIVADDASTDNTEAVLKKMGNHKIKYLKIEHAGLPATPRNAAIKIAKGDWLAFLDSDDEWQKEKMEKQFSALRQTGLLASSTNAYVKLPTGITKRLILDCKKKTIKLGDLLLGDYIICSSAVIHRSIIQTTSGFPEDIRFKAIEDCHLWLRVSVLTDFAYINEPLVIYTDDPKNSIRGEQYASDELKKKVLVMKDFKKWMKKRYPFSLRLNFTIAMSKIYKIPLFFYNKIKRHEHPPHR